MTCRALFVGNFLSASGTHRLYVEDLTERLESRGWSVHRTSTLRPKLARLADMLATCWRRRADYEVAFIDVFSGSAFVWAELAASLLERLGKPYILTLRGGQLPEFAHKWPRRVRRLFRHAATVCAPSQFLASALGEYANIEIIPNAVDVSRYQSRRSAHISPQLVWLRAFHDVYNPTMAVEVLAGLVQNGRDATLTMIGADKLDGSWQRVQATAARLNVNDRLTLVPGIPKQQVPAALSRGDIFLNTANVDNTPVSVLEALATGMVVVSTDVGGIPYLLTHGRDALLVPAGDVASMTTAIETVLDDGALATALRREARATALRNSWDIVLERWDDLYVRGTHNA